MSRTIHAFDYLKSPEDSGSAAVCVVFGDEPFLKRLVLKQLCGQTDGDDESLHATFEGKTAEWRDVFDELATVSLFGSGQRIALVDEADEFVRTHRERLEAYVERPKSSGLLILNADQWPSNTRLYKAIDKSGLQVECRAPQKTVGRRKVLDESSLAKWLVSRARQVHQIKLQPMASQVLLALVGPEFGLLDQDLAKLALYLDVGGEVSAEMVEEIVGGWRAKTIWELLDAACDGNAGDALQQLDHLLRSGENPIALFGQISWSLRRFAAAARVYRRAESMRRRIGLRQALEQAGFKPWPKGALEKAERQLKRMGRDRASQLYRWLLEADLALKGSHSTPHRARLVLELLILRMARGVSCHSATR